MTFFDRLFGSSPKVVKPHAMEPDPLVSIPALSEPSVRPAGLNMNTEPWTFTGLPPGVTASDFLDAAAALTSLRMVGRVMPMPATAIQEKGLSGVAYPRNVARIRSALGKQSLTDLPHLVDQRNPEPGIYVPGLLWEDGSEADGTRPVACIGPTGYFGSLWREALSAELHGLVESEAHRGHLLAVPLAIDPTPDHGGVHGVRMLVPSPEQLERFRRWLRTPAATGGEPPYERPVVASAWLRRLADYQDELDGLLGDASDVEVNVRLTLGITGKGKYAGQNLIQADVLDRTIGVVPAQYRAESPEFFDAVESGTTNGSARITRSPERIAVRVTLRGD